MGESNDVDDNGDCLSKEAGEVLREVDEVEETGEDVQEEGNEVGVKGGTKESGKVLTVGYGDLVLRLIRGTHILLLIIRIARAK